MVVAHDAGDAPIAGLLLPHHHELGVAAVVAAVFDVAEALGGDVPGPVVFYRALGEQAYEAFAGLGEVAH